MTTLAEVVASTVDLIALFDGRESEMRAWWAGTATGGYNSDGTVSDGIAPHGGFYPATNSVGVTTYKASIAHLASIMQKGDTGTAASQDVAIDVTGTFGPSEYMAGFICPVITTYSASGSYAKCKVAPTASYQILINKNGIGWGTITFAAGSTTGVIANVGIVANGDLIEYYAPATPDATFTHLIHTLRGT